MDLRVLERRGSVFPGGARVSVRASRRSPDRRSSAAINGISNPHQELAPSGSFQNQKVWTRGDADRTHTPADAEKRFQIESKSFRFQLSGTKLLQIGEVKGRKEFRFWLNLPVHQWICSCLAKAIRSTTTWKQQFSDRNRVLSFNLELNRSGFFVRIQENRVDGAVWISIPEGDNRFGFRVFLSELKNFDLFLGRGNIGLVDCHCFLEGKQTQVQEMALSPSQLLLEADLQRMGIPPCPDKFDLESVERDRSKRLKNGLQPLSLCDCCAMQTGAIFSARSSLLPKHILGEISAAAVPREAETVEATLATAVEEQELELTTTPTGKLEIGAANVSQMEAQQVQIHGTQAQQDKPKPSDGKVPQEAKTGGGRTIPNTAQEVIYEENGLLFVKSLNSTRRSQQEDCRSPNEGLNAFKRYATTGFKQVLAAGRNAAASYNLRFKGAKSESKTVNKWWSDNSKNEDSKAKLSPLHIALSTLNVEAEPFIPQQMTTFNESVVVDVPLPQDSQVDTSPRDKGKKLQAEEAVYPSEEEGEAEEDGTPQLKDDFVIGRGRKTSKSKKSKHKKKKK